MTPSATIAQKNSAAVRAYGIAFTAEWSVTDLGERCEFMVIHRWGVVDASNAVQTAIEIADGPCDEMNASLSPSSTLQVPQIVLSTNHRFLKPLSHSELQMA